MLVARLGLRSVEVARLCLDDIDWWAGKFAVRGKAHTPIAFLCRSRWARR
ncbi:MAG TPA: hypothetical protein VKU92_01925 [Acidimicrobiales bacterium]|nr:hypothetical protein [Acidimicrobiales bacterium]